MTILTLEGPYDGNNFIVWCLQTNISIERLMPVLKETHEIAWKTILNCSIESNCKKSCLQQPLNRTDIPLHPQIFGFIVELKTATMAVITCG